MRTSRPGVVLPRAIVGADSFLSPLELLFVTAVVVAVVVGTVVRAPVGAFLETVLPLTALLVVVAVAVAALLRLPPRLARLAFDVSLTFVVYAGLTPLFAGMGARAIDATLRRIEVALLGVTLVQVAEPFVSDPATIFFCIAYSLHVPLFFVPVYLHWRAGRFDRAIHLNTTLGLAMYVGFVLYVLFPAYGPVGMQSSLTPLTSNIAIESVARHGVALGTFPSLHGGISAAVAIDAWRTSRRWGIAFTVVGVLIWLSTIYLRYHWLPDLVAGLALAIACTWAAGWVGRHLTWPRLASVGVRREASRPVIEAAEGS